MITTINGFYEEKEILEAKALLFNTVKKMNITDDVPRMKKRQGEAKCRADVEDIISMFDFLDTKQLQLPVEFVAKNLQRIPMVTPSDVDVFKLAENVKCLTEQMKDMQQVMNTVAQMQNFQAVHNTSGSQDVTKLSTESQSSATRSMSFAEIMAQQEEAEKTWFVNKKKLISQKPLKKITGTKKDSEVKAVESSVHLFVGSLKPETGEKELTGMLVSQWLEVIACSLLPKKAEWQKHYAAFRVVIRTAHKENIFKEDIWPEGAEVREWYFKPR